MIEPADLLATATSLMRGSPEQPVSEAGLRRGVSTAYYAVFHHILRSTADCFAGASKRGHASYAVIYRSITHKHVSEICKKLSRSPLSDTMRQQTGRSTVSAGMKEVARTFVLLQEMREVADYQPVDDAFVTEDFQSVIQAAEDAIRAFDAADAEERTAVLAVLLAGQRR